MTGNRHSTESFLTALQALSCINQSRMKISSENKLGQFKQTFCNGIIVVKFYGFLCLVSRPFLYATGRFYLKYSISVAFLKGKESWAC